MKNKYLVCDTETVGLDKPDVYDIAWQIIDKHGKVYAERQYIVKETITDPDKMRNAFYHRKVYTDYIPSIAEGKFILESWANIREQFNKDLFEHNVNVFAAYNAGFDMRSISFTNGRRGFIEKRDIKILDIWQFACETILSHKTYKMLAAKQAGFIKEKTGNIVTNAEKAFAYISGNWEYIEEHTALEDVKIESKILHSCLRQKKKIPYNVYNQQPWRIVNA